MSTSTVVLQGHRGRDIPAPATAMPAERSRGRMGIINGLPLIPAAAWCLVERRDVTKETEASMVCCSLTMPRCPRTAHGARMQLVSSSYTQSLVRRTHLLPSCNIWATGTRTKPWGQAEDLQLNSGVSHLQKALQIYQAMHRRHTKNAHSFLDL